MSQEESKDEPEDDKSDDKEEGEDKEEAEGEDDDEEEDEDAEEEEDDEEEIVDPKEQLEEGQSTPMKPIRCFARSAIHRSGPMLLESARGDTPLLTRALIQTASNPNSALPPSTTTTSVSSELRLLSRRTRAPRRTALRSVRLFSQTALLSLGNP